MKQGSFSSNSSSTPNANTTFQSFVSPQMLGQKSEQKPQTLRIKFSIGKNLIFLDMLKPGLQNAISDTEAPSILLETVFETENIPLYLRSSIECAIDLLLKDETLESYEEALAVNDLAFVVKQGNDLKQQSELNENGMTMTSPTFGEAYQFLCSVSVSVRDNLVQLETDYAVALKEMYEKKGAALKQLSKKQSEEMQEASEGNANVSMLVAQQVDEMESLEKEWNERIRATKAKQKEEYHNFVMSFYDIERVRQEENLTMTIPENVTSESNPLPSSPTPARNFPTGSLSKRKGINFFANAYKRLTPQTNNLEKQTVDPYAVLFSKHEGFTVKVKENLYGLQFMNCSLTDLANVQSRTPVYSSSVSGYILLVDPELKYQTSASKEFINLCRNGATEFHFDELETQLNVVKLQDEWPLPEGTCFITKHSNLGLIHVVFHLVVDPKTNTLEFPLKSSILKGLQNIFLVAANHNVESLFFPILLTETDENVIPQSGTFLERFQQVLEATKILLESDSVTGQGLYSFHYLLPPIRTKNFLAETIRPTVLKLFPFIVGE